MFQRMATHLTSIPFGANPDCPLGARTADDTMALALSDTNGALIVNLELTQQGWVLEAGAAVKVLIANGR